MLILALNSAATHTEIALMDGGKIVFEKSWISQRNEGEKLLPAIELALKKVGRYARSAYFYEAKGRVRSELRYPFQKLDAVFVVAGPGSFSGLRIGVTIANALAFSQNIPLFACDTFQLLNAKLAAPKRAKACILISAGGQNIAVSKGLSTNAVHTSARPRAEREASSSPKGARKVEQLEIEKFPLWLKKNKEIKFVAADLKKGQKIPGIKFEKLNSFGQAVKTILSQKLKPHRQKMVKPVYLRKPNITKSKKEVFI